MILKAFNPNPERTDEKIMDLVKTPPLERAAYNCCLYLSRYTGLTATTIKFTNATELPDETLTTEPNSDCGYPRARPSIMHTYPNNTPSRSRLVERSTHTVVHTSRVLDVSFERPATPSLRWVGGRICVSARERHYGVGCRRWSRISCRSQLVVDVESKSRNYGKFRPRS